MDYTYTHMFYERFDDRATLLEAQFNHILAHTRIARRMRKLFKLLENYSEPRKKEVGAY